MVFHGVKQWDAAGPPLSRRAKNPVQGRTRKNMRLPVPLSFYLRSSAFSASSPIDNIQPNQRFGNLVIGAGCVQMIGRLYPCQSTVSVCIRVLFGAGPGGPCSVSHRRSFCPPSFRTLLRYPVHSSHSEHLRLLSHVCRLPWGCGMEGVSAVILSFLRHPR